MVLVLANLYFVAVRATIMIMTKTIHSSAELTSYLKDQSQNQNTPFIIESNNEGFTLRLNIVDKKWYTILQKNGIQQTFTIEAKVNEKKRSVTTVDILNSLEWSAGAGMEPGDVAPSLGGRIETVRGEVYQFGTRKEFGMSESGKLGMPVDYSFNTTEAKRWLGAQLKMVGWKREWGVEAKIGLWFAAVAGVGSIIGTILLIALWMTGYFNQ